MAKHHRDKLRPAVESTRVPFGVGCDHGALKVRPRKKLKQLIEDAAKSRHRGWASEPVMVSVATRPSAYSARSTPFAFR
jgi:hypothetical protein